MTLVVDEGDTAIAFGSGDVPALATPRVLALAEEAAVAALGGELGEGKTSVGVHAELRHVKATPLGGAVTAHAVVIGVDGSGVTFEFSVLEGEELVAYGTHKRVIVDRDRFTAGL